MDLRLGSTELVDGGSRETARHEGWRGGVGNVICSIPGHQAGAHGCRDPRNPKGRRPPAGATDAGAVPTHPQRVRGGAGAPPALPHRCTPRSSIFVPICTAPLQETGHRASYVGNEGPKREGEGKMEERVRGGAGAHRGASWRERRTQPKEENRRVHGATEICAEQPRRSCGRTWIT